MPTITATTILSTGSYSFPSSLYIGVAGGDAVYASATSTPTLTNAGTLATGTAAGIYAVKFKGGGTVNNSGSIGPEEGTHGEGAVYIGGSGASVANTGNISGGLAAVLFDSGGNVANAANAAIAGTYRGVWVRNGYGTVSNAGTIVGTTQLGVELDAGGEVTNLAGGTIAGGSKGVFLGGGGTLDNAGTIAGGTTASFNAGAYFGLYGSVTNAASGLITGYVALVGLAAAVTVSNAGTLSATDPWGVQLDHGGSIANAAGGTIMDSNTISVGGAAIRIEGAVGYVSNAGVITGSRRVAGGGYAESRGVYLGYGGDVTNQSGGLISGVGINGGGGTVSNFGTIGVYAGYGILIGGGGSVSNAAAGLIIGYSAVLGEAAAATVDNAGTISGHHYGLALDEGGSVTNQAGGKIVTDIVGVQIKGGIGTALNDGTIQGDVKLEAGGTITNERGALISSGLYAVRVLGGAGTISNFGTIMGNASDEMARTDGAAVYVGSLLATVTNAYTVTNGTGGSIAGYLGILLQAGGSVTNAAGGSISGNTLSDYGAGIEMLNGAGYLRNAGSISGPVAVYATHATVSNFGTVTGNAQGVRFGGGGTVTDQPGGVISGYLYAISIAGGGTVTNAGTIAAIGVHSKAVQLAAGSPNRVIVDPGAVFVGAVDGGNTIGATAVSTLELATGSGTLRGIGSSFSNFGSITFDPGATWDIGGSTSGLASGEVISGFVKGDTIDLTGFIATGKSFLDNVLTLTGATTQTLSLPGSYVTANFTLESDGSRGGGTNITVACFAAGTRILTVRGEVAVETLRFGDVLPTMLDGRRGTVRWVGNQPIDCRRHPRPREVWPVRVQAGAFAPRLPHRDLWLSPDHAVFINKTLIPVRYLVNGASIAQVEAANVEYWHVELDRHEVILAEGLPAESYLDTGNRSAFERAVAELACQVVWPEC